MHGLPAMDIQGAARGSNPMGYYLHGVQFEEDVYQLGDGKVDIES